MKENENSFQNRKSNIELLRIIAMFMVMILHVILGLDTPTCKEIHIKPLSVFTQLFFELFSICSVNTFVLISGWFGLRPSIKKLSSFIFQCIFFTWGIFAIMTFSGESSISLKSLDTTLFVRSWFVQAYLILYLISPALNLLIENTNKHTYQYLLLGLLLMEFFYDFCATDRIFGGGYSGMHFIILYLLAQYVRKYGIWPIIEKYTFFWFSLVVITLTCFRFWLISQGYPEIHRLGQYTSPFIIFTSLCLLIGFYKLNFTSKFINQIASSSFTVYLIHTNSLILIPIYIKFANILYEQYSGIIYLCSILIYMILWFTMSILLDKVRIKCWSYTSFKIFQNNATKKLD